MIVEVPATKALLDEYYDGRQMPTMQAWVWLEDGKPVGVSGFMNYRYKVKVLFSDVDDGMTAQHRIQTLKFAKKMLKIADEKGWTLIAHPNEELETAERFLTYLGFQPNEHGEYVRCPAQNG